MHIEVNILVLLIPFSGFLSRVMGDFCIRQVGRHPRPLASLGQFHKPSLTYMVEMGSTSDFKFSQPLTPGTVLISAFLLDYGMRQDGRRQPD